MKVYDLTQTLSANTPIFPGDPCFSAKNILSLKESNYNLQLLEFGNHSGTHIDFPAHVIENGKKSIDYPIDHLIGQGIIIECPKNLSGGVSINHINPPDPNMGDIVFFKRATYLEASLVAFLIRKRIKIVGVDSLSVDSPDDNDLPIHHMLLSNDILIVEGLFLDNICKGRGEILIAPLKINSDGVPSRVLMWR